LPVACGKGKWAMTVAGTSVGFGVWSLAIVKLANPRIAKGRANFFPSAQNVIGHFTS
jgi:hypothetical protein